VLYKVYSKHLIQNRILFKIESLLIQNRIICFLLELELLDLGYHNFGN